MKTKEQEQYLHKIATRVLEWAEVRNDMSIEYTQEELWDLIMLELLNEKQGV